MGRREGPAGRVRWCRATAVSPPRPPVPSPPLPHPRRRAHQAAAGRRRVAAARGLRHPRRRTRAPGLRGERTSQQSMQPGGVAGLAATLRAAVACVTARARQPASQPCHGRARTTCMWQQAVANCQLGGAGAVAGRQPAQRARAASTRCSSPPSARPTTRASTGADARGRQGGRDHQRRVLALPQEEHRHGVSPGAGRLFAPSPVALLRHCCLAGCG